MKLKLLLVLSICLLLVGCGSNKEELQYKKVKLLVIMMK